MRCRLAPALLVLVLAGCGSSSTRHGATGSAAPASLNAIWTAAGESVALVNGTSDHSPGSVRVSFLVVRRNARPVETARALVLVARALSARPFARTWARLERVGASRIFVAHVTIPRPGRYLS